MSIVCRPNHELNRWCLPIKNVVYILTELPTIFLTCTTYVSIVKNRYSLLYCHWHGWAQINKYEIVKIIKFGIDVCGFPLILDGCVMWYGVVFRQRYNLGQLLQVWMDEIVNKKSSLRLMEKFNGFKSDVNGRGCSWYG